MFNIRISGIVAGAAFILSFLIGLVSRTSAPMLILRPVIFGVLFFVISGAVHFLVNRFLPELLEGGAGDDDSILLPGSRVNIVEGEGSASPYQRAAVPGRAFMGAQPDDSDEGIGDVGALLARRGIDSGASRDASTPFETLDQNARSGYTGDGDLAGFPGAGSSEAPRNAAAKGPESGGAGIDVLPDLDSMAGAFLPSAANDGVEAQDYSVSAPSPKPKSSPGSKAAGWAGDFNAKDMAAGLRTILNKEKEG